MSHGLDEYSALLDNARGNPTRSSYTLGESETRSNVSRMKRVMSTPAIPSHKLKLLEITPFMLKKYYMAKGGTLVSSAFNLASATLGAGALALPSAMLHSGFIVGILTLAVVYLFTVYSIYLLIKVGVLHELYSYEAIADDLLGSYSQEITGLFIVLFCWGVAVVYIVVMGDFMTPLMSTLGISHIIGRKTVMTIFFFCIMFPLSLARQVNTLRYASIVGCASTLLLAMATVIRTIEKGDTLSHMPMARFDTDSVSAISTYVFSYCCQPVAFSIFLEMKNASTKRYDLLRLVLHVDLHTVVHCRWCVWCPRVRRGHPPERPHQPRQPLGYPLRAVGLPWHDGDGDHVLPNDHLPHPRVGRAGAGVQGGRKGHPASRV
ncbi:amino acid permease-like protein [Angomonas deanei]|nr:amino acid permease-like protein [Angomonas deanei]|eukprot:EPY41520.1 amino acid permease-like protein [Angomonas deanei]